jgi:hypothetical protein
MLFGAHKQDTEDRDMTVTVAFNHFGPGLIQRLPRYTLGKVPECHFQFGVSKIEILYMCVSCIRKEHVSSGMG